MGLSVKTNTTAWQKLLAVLALKKQTTCLGTAADWGKVPRTPGGRCGEWPSPAGARGPAVSLGTAARASL